MALLQLLQKALLLLNVVLLLLLNMTGNGIAAATKKGITSAKDGAVTVLNYIQTRILQPSVLPCQNSVCVCVCLSRGDYYFTNKLYPLCIAVGPESIFILDMCGFYRGRYSSTSSLYLCVWPKQLRQRNVGGRT